jgi:multiple sugar transport system ATP-binding protein
VSVSVEVAGLAKRFAGGAGLSDCSFAVAAGEHVTVVGPSGAGKTTLLRLIAGLETPDAGRVRLAGADVAALPPHRRRLAFIGQRPALYPHLPVLRNLTIGVELRRGLWRPDAELTAKARKIADQLGIGTLLGRSIDSLSGGEAQRVALGRALVSDHPLWLLDEPFAHLDRTTATRIREQMHLQARRTGPTIIEVTHDPGDALSGERVIALTDGRVAQIGPPAEVSARPISAGVATSLGWPPMNIIDGPAAPAAGATGTACVWGVRPTDCGVGPAPPGSADLGEWELVRIEPCGPAPLWVLARDGTVFRRWPDPGDEPAKRVRLHARRWRRFDARTGLMIDSAPEGPADEQQ